MALDLTNLAQLAYANGFRVWHYDGGDDTLATIMADGYFDDASHMLHAGDEIKIEASDGYWTDIVWSVVTTAGSEDVAIGVQVNTVDDSVDGAAYPLGYRRKRFDGSEWMYLEADAAVAVKDAVIIHADMGSQPITATLAAVDAGMGKKVAVAPLGTLSQSIAAGDFYWGCIYAPPNAGVEVNLAAAADDYENLQPTATAGKLDDTAAAGTSYIAGLVITVAASGAEAEVADITYPYVADYPQGA